MLVYTKLTEVILIKCMYWFFSISLFLNIVHYYSDLISQIEPVILFLWVDVLIIILLLN